MKKPIRLFVCCSLALCIVITWIVIVQASNGSAPSTDSVISSKDIIMVLFGLLQTIFLGMCAWMVANDRELFKRMGAVESKQSTQDAICKERNEQGAHQYNRASDKDDSQALKEAVDTLRRILNKMEVTAP